MLAWTPVRLRVSEAKKRPCPGPPGYEEPLHFQWVTDLNDCWESSDQQSNEMEDLQFSLLPFILCLFNMIFNAQ